MNPFEIEHLPRDLTIEILSHLPSKDLCKLRCVSKSWRTLLTLDKELMSRHIQISRKNPLSLIRRYISNGVTTEIELTSVDSRGTTIDQFRKTIDGPVNTFISCGPLSLLCCARSLYICNPSTRKVVRVPRSGARLQNVGLGYLPMTNEYKIVHMFEMGCEIFSFGVGRGVSSGRWRGVGGCPISSWAVEYPVCASGGIYWAVSSGVWKDKEILWIDLEKEEFGRIDFPVDGEKKYTGFECVGLMGGLCVVGFLSRGMDVWRMRGKGEWRVEYRVDLFPLCPKFLIPCGDFGDEILVHVEGVELVCCSVGSGSLRKVEYYKGMKSYNKPCLYYDSLVPL